LIDPEKHCEWVNSEVAFFHLLGEGLMKQRKRGTPTSVSQSHERRLASYALAAGAASLGALALTATAQAEVVYTPTYKSLPFQTYGEGPGYPLDLNGDGIPDFGLIHSTFGNGQHAWVRPANHGNRVLGVSIHASAFEPGASVGPAGPFAHRAAQEPGTSMGGFVDSSGFITYFGQWWDVHNRYLGLKFVINGEYHFGWARISYNAYAMVLTGYAYETDANKPITAGDEGGDEATNDAAPDSTALVAECASLGRLAQGAAGLVAWRREAA
jgi:hypothetical protein